MVTARRKVTMVHRMTVQAMEEVKRSSMLVIRDDDDDKDCCAAIYHIWSVSSGDMCDKSTEFEQTILTQSSTFLLSTHCVLHIVMLY